MSFLDRLRNLISGPPRISGGGDPESAADLHEEYGTREEGEAELTRLEGTGGGGGLGSDRFGTSEAAETAEDDLSTEEAPPDPSP